MSEQNETLFQFRPGSRNVTSEPSLGQIVSSPACSEILADSERWPDRFILRLQRKSLICRWRFRSFSRFLQARFEHFPDRFVALSNPRSSRSSRSFLILLHSRSWVACCALRITCWVLRVAYYGWWVGVAYYGLRVARCVLRVVFLRSF